MLERQPAHLGTRVEIDENQDRIRRLSPISKSYLRLTAIAQFKSIAPETRQKARSRACNLFNEMTDETVEELTGYLQWRQDRIVANMKDELAKRPSRVSKQNGS